MNVDEIAALDPEVIRKRVIKRAQELLDHAKINEAQDLLASSKEMPDRMISLSRDGVALRGEKKYEKSARVFEEAAQCAAALQEGELEATLRAEATRTLEIPGLEKSRDKAIEQARDLLRREKFLKAAEKYKEAAGYCDRLGDVAGKELNEKKHTILSQFGSLE